MQLCSTNHEARLLSKIAPSYDFFSLLSSLFLFFVLLKALRSFTNLVVQHAHVTIIIISTLVILCSLVITILLV